MDPDHFLSILANGYGYSAIVPLTVFQNSALLLFPASFWLLMVLDRAFGGLVPRVSTFHRDY